MSEPIGYQYVVLRCIPAIEREEFLNVGVVLYAQDADFLQGAFHLDEAKLTALAPGLDIESLRASLQLLCRVVAGEPHHAAPDFSKPGQRFGWLSAPRSTVLQAGPVHGGTTTDPAGTLDHLMSRLVR